jgi:DNA-binding beta-propeller fold protein YncE
MRSYKEFPVKTILAVSLAALPLHAVAATIAQPAYTVEQRLALGGKGGWDYPSIDPATHLLYLSRADHVAVVDTASGKQVASITDTAGVHGIALAPALNRGFISCGATNLVKVFDLATNAVLADIPVGDGPDAILFEPATSRVFAFNGRGHSVSVIDAGTNAMLGSIALGGKPEFARADGQGRVLVNIEDTAELAELDATALSVVKRWPLRHCEEPSGLALDAAHHRSFSVCDNKVMAILDVASGKPVATLPIGGGADGAEYDAASGDVYSANGEGTLTVVHRQAAGGYVVRQTLPTQRGARTIALDTATHRIYLPTAEFGPMPAAGAEGGHKRPPIIDDSFVVLVVSAVAPAAK